MRKERQNLQVVTLEANEGQLDWLPKNPRQWSKQDIEKTKASILEDTDFLEDRPLLVTPNGDTFVVFAGNLRREGAVAAALETVPCIVYSPENEEDALTIKRRAMKDNGSFGSWDYDELANSWDDLPLIDYGVPAWDFRAEKPNFNASKPTGEVNLGGLNPTYNVQVTCSTIEAQLKLIAELDERGYKCKAI